MSNKNYDPLDDVPLSIRQSMVVQPQPSPSYSVITDRMTPEGHPQSHKLLEFWSRLGVTAMAKLYLCLSDGCLRDFISKDDPGTPNHCICHALGM